MNDGAVIVLIGAETTIKTTVDSVTHAASPEREDTR